MPSKFPLLRGIAYYMWSIGLLLSVVVFMVGYHNTDLSHNILALSYMENSSIIDNYSDLTLGGEILTYYEGYRLGMSQMMLGFFMGLASIKLMELLK